MKKILVISYSQSGQLEQILNSLVSGIDTSEFHIEIKKINTKKTFQFPWNRTVFFDTMPDCVLEKEYEINDITFENEQYDLIILGFQPWFLSPSIPITSLLKHDNFKKIIQNSKVITVIGARNMWMNAFFDVKKHINQQNGEIIANLPLIDRNSNLISAITIVYWMLSGKKDKLFNFFPTPGISKYDINRCKKAGQIISHKIQSNTYKDIQPMLIESQDINIKWNILFIEKRAKRLFKIWANLIDKKGTTPTKRKVLVKIFSYYLAIALFVISPILLTVYYLIPRWFVTEKERKEKNDVLYNLKKWN